VTNADGIVVVPRDLEGLEQDGSGGELLLTALDLDVIAPTL